MESWQLVIVFVAFFGAWIALRRWRVKVRQRAIREASSKLGMKFLGHSGLGQETFWQLPLFRRGHSGKYGNAMEGTIDDMFVRSVQKYLVSVLQIRVWFSSSRNNVATVQLDWL